jgi:membrane-associated phospholipid phosphatase
MDDTLIKLIADGAVVPVVLLGAWALLAKLPKGAPRLEVYARILMAGLTAYLVAKLIGSIFQPETMRPFEKLGVDAGASFLNNPGFPSDHVLFCMAISLAVWFETTQRKIAVALFGLTALVGIGRIMALVHTPLDVLGGAVIACVGIVWYLQRPKHKQHEPDARKKRKSTV